MTIKDQVIIGSLILTEHGYWTLTESLNSRNRSEIPLNPPRIMAYLEAYRIMLDACGKAFSMKRYK